MKNIVMAMSLFTLLNVVNESAAMNSSFGKSFSAYDEVKHAIGFYSIKKVQGEDINKNEEDRHALFCYAIQKGVNSVVEELISQGVDIIHEQDEDGREALHYAVCANSANMVNLLFKWGANINAESKWGTPLHYAIWQGLDEMVTLLIKLGADVNKKDPYGDSPLCTALWSGADEIMEQLISAGAKIDTRDSFGCTLLHLAALRGNEKFAERLILAKMNINAIDKKGVTPLSYAGKGSSMYQLLCSYGATK